MIEKDDILLQEVAEALRSQQAPQVDVTQRVMASLPDLKVRRMSVLLRVVKHASVAAAACLLMIVAVDITRLYAHDYDEAALGAMLAKTNDADIYFDDYADYESAIGLDFASLDY